jgi:hypothetical protein
MDTLDETAFSDIAMIRKIDLLIGLCSKVVNVSILKRGVACVSIPVIRPREQKSPGLIAGAGLFHLCSTTTLDEFRTASIKNTAEN